MFPSSLRFFTSLIRNVMFLSGYDRLVWFRPEIILAEFFLIIPKTQ